MFGSLKGHRTYVAAGLTIVGAVAAYLMGDMEFGPAFNAVSTAVIGTFLRSGVKSA